MIAVYALSKRNVLRIVDFIRVNLFCVKPYTESLMITSNSRVSQL